MLTPESTMLRWWLRASASHKKILAASAKTSVNHLRHLAYGRRGISADLAQRLAKGSKTLNSSDLVLDQRELCAACGVCPLAKSKYG